MAPLVINKVRNKVMIEIGKRQSGYRTISDDSSSLRTLQAVDVAEKAALFVNIHFLTFLLLSRRIIEGPFLNFRLEGRPSVHSKEASVFLI